MRQPDPATKLQSWVPRPPTSNPLKKTCTEKISRKEDSKGTTELINFQSIGKSEDNPSLSDMDNGNGKVAPKDNRTKHRPVFTKTESKAITPPSSSTGLSLLQIYMRQRSQTSMERDSNKKSDDVIASGGGEGWVEDYPSSADEKLGLESISSSLADEEEDDDDDDDESDEDSEDDDDLCQNNRSLTLTDISDIEQTSIQIDAVPFNTTAASSSLDKLIAKIKPFELGLSPASIEEHWNFESRMRSVAPVPEAKNVGLMDKSCQAAINPASSATQEESTLTDPIKPQAYLIFPSYSLPDLSFLKKHDYTWIGDVLLSPQNLPASARKPEPVVRQTQRTFDDLKKRQMGHVKDWESLKILLPEEIRQQINSIKPLPAARSTRPRPKSCEHNVVLRDSKKTAPRPATCRGSVAWPDTAPGYMLPTVPQSPPGGDGCNHPPPLPKRTASLPAASSARQRRCAGSAIPVEPVKSAVTRRVRADPAPTAPMKPAYGYTMRKTVSFGEHLSGGFLKMANQRRPLSLSHWSGGGSLDMNSPDDDPTISINLEQKQGKKVVFLFFKLLRLVTSAVF